MAEWIISLQCSRHQRYLKKYIWEWLFQQRKVLDDFWKFSCWRLKKHNTLMDAGQSVSSVFQYYVQEHSKQFFKWIIICNSLNYRLGKQQLPPTIYSIHAFLLHEHGFFFPTVFRIKKNWIQLILSTLDHLLLHQKALRIIWQNCNRCFFWQGRLVESQFWSRSVNCTQAFFSCHSLSPPKWVNLLLCFESVLPQPAWKYRALHTQTGDSCLPIATC